MNEDLNCPMEGGTFIPDCGSMARLIEASTGRFQNSLENHQNIH